MTRTPTPANSKHPLSQPLSSGARLIDLLRKVKPHSLTWVMFCMLLSGLYLTSLYSYLLFHTLTEMFSIVVCSAMFLLVWNSRYHMDNQTFLFIGLSSFFIAVLDLIHTLAFKGMNIFPDYDANLPTQLWIAARYLQSISLLLAILFINRQVRILQIMLTYSLVTAALLVSIFARVFPVCYVTGVGLTEFKITSEYIIVCLLLVASWGLWRIRSRFDEKLAQLLVLANFLTVGAELAFTSYISVYGPANAIGHLFKFVASALWYYAIVRAGILRPIEFLLRSTRSSEINLRRAESLAQLGYWEFRPAENIVSASAGASLIFGLPVEEWTLANVLSIPLPEYRPMLEEIIRSLGKGGPPASFEYRILRQNDGQLRDIHAIAEYDATRKLVFGTFQDITERKQSEERLKESESRYRLLFENMGEGFALHEIITGEDGQARDFRFLEMNSAYERHTGVKPEGAIGKTILELMPQVDRRQIETYGRVALTGEPLVFEYYSKAFNRHFRVHAFSPQIRRFATIFEDITERKLAEEALSGSEKRFRAIIEISPVPMALNDNQQNITFLNPAFIQTFGYDLEDIPTLADWWPRAYPDPVYRKSVAESWQVNLEHARQTGSIFSPIEITIMCKNGTRRTVMAGASSILNTFEDDHLVVLYDITERKQTEEALLASEKQYHAIFDLNAAIKLLVDPATGEIVKANQAAADYYGWPVAQLERMNIGQINTLPDKQLKVEMGQVASQLRSYLTYQNILANGEIRDVEIYASPVEIGGRSLIYSIMHDVSDRKKAEEALRQSEMFLSEVIENSGVIIFAKDREGHYELVNRKWENDTGFKRENAIGKTDQDLFPGPLAQEFRENDLRVIEEGLAVETEEYSEHATGRHYYVTIKLPLRDKNNIVTGICGISTDITERKMAAEQLREAHGRLEQRVQERTNELQDANLALVKASRAKDEFLASMSHELRTPLAGILGLSEVLQMPHIGSLNAKQSTYIGHIHESGQHLLELINEILDLSKLESGKVELVLSSFSLREICQASLKLTGEQAAAKQLTSHFSMEPESIIFTVDPLRFKQIVVNLLSNAIKFTPTGGSFGIEIIGKELENQVQLTVWDTGIGIQAEDLPRLFQSFVQLDARLSRQYEGTGLGLALVRRLAELHGGSVSVQSTPGLGSRFTICLPWRQP